jgi:hypothetical protein
MSAITAKELAGSMNVLTASSGAGTSIWGALEWWDFVNTNAAGLGVLLTLIFGLAAIGFNLYNSTKANKNEQDIDSHGEKLDLHIKQTRIGIDEILRKLNDKENK